MQEGNSTRRTGVQTVRFTLVHATRRTRHQWWPTVLPICRTPGVVRWPTTICTCRGSRSKRERPATELPTSTFPTTFAARRVSAITRTSGGEAPCAVRVFEPTAHLRDQVGLLALRLRARSLAEMQPWARRRGLLQAALPAPRRRATSASEHLPRADSAGLGPGVQPPTASLEGALLGQPVPLAQDVGTASCATTSTRSTSAWRTSLWGRAACRPADRR